MEAIVFPSPEDPGRAPIWDNYVVAQAAQAALGLIPSSTLALGVEIDGYDVCLHFQLSQLDDQGIVDMRDIGEELEILLGDAAKVTTAYEVRDERSLSPSDGVRWFFAARDRGRSGAR